jgi:hypothetical protein
VRAAAEALLLDDETVAPWLPLRPARGHKATNGYLACVCGSLEYAGAARGRGCSTGWSGHGRPPSPAADPSRRAGGITPLCPMTGELGQAWLGKK